LSVVAKTDLMATETDYYIMTFETGDRLGHWGWELSRRSRPMGVKIGDCGYQSQSAAEHAGKIALARFLDELAKEERRSR
jgi:hypothetical protein